MIKYAQDVSRHAAINVSSEMKAFPSRTHTFKQTTQHVIISLSGIKQ